MYGSDEGFWGLKGPQETFNDIFFLENSYKVKLISLYAQKQK